MLLIISNQVYRFGNLCLSLQEIYPKPDLKERLICGFLEANPTAERASIVKKIQNWMNKKNVPVKREDIFILCFALQLSEEAASFLLGFVSDYGIHYRSPTRIGLLLLSSFRKNIPGGCTFL